MESTALINTILLLVSPFVGSFLAVLVDRLPRGEDVVIARSACRTCKTALRPLDLIPVLSFALKRGRCGRCSAVIPPWLLYVELLAIGAAVLAVIKGGWPETLVLNVSFLWLLIALAATDLKWFRLPDILTGLLALVAFALAFGDGGIGLRNAVLGAAIGAGAFWLLRVVYQKVRGREGLGLGDVKLMVGLGAFVGPLDLPWLVLGAALIGLAGALLAVFRSGSAVSGTGAVPFGAALCAAAAVLWGLR